MSRTERLIRLSEAADILACGERTARRTLEEFGVVPARIGRRGAACTAWRLADVEDVVVHMAARARDAAESSGRRRPRASAFTPPRSFEEFAAAFGPAARGAVQ